MTKDFEAQQEQRRHNELKAYGLLDTDNEPVFDDIVKAAAKKFGVPIALISLIDSDRQWFKARHGLKATETPRTISFCTHAIQGGSVFVVEDATRDAHFQHSPLVTGDPNIRFYAGAPLKTGTGRRIGTLCVIDHKVRPALSEAARRALEEMAAEVMTAVEERSRRLAADAHWRSESSKVA